LEIQVATISFTVPLAEPVTANVIKAEEGEGEPKENLPEGCKGTSKAPIAEAGHLCVFVASEENVLGFSVRNLETSNTLEAGKGGAVVQFSPKTKKEVEFAFGSWVVTAK
jgi:hypothetical protein